MKIQSNNFKELGLIPTPSSIKKLDLNFPFAKIIDIEFDKEDPFFNVNTKEDLEKAEKILND